MVTRRQFLGFSGGAAAATAAGGAALWAGLLRDHVEEGRRLGAVPAPADGATVAPGPVRDRRVVVVVQLGGGNDGLATLVPADGRLRDLRPTLARPEAELLALPGVTGWSLAPELAPLVDHWNAGRLVAVEGIGMPDQSRSHFAAMDAWWTATDGPSSAGGWLGRWLDTTEAPGGPNPLRAIALGGGGPALAGARSLPTVVLDPARFTLAAPRGCSAAALTDAFLACAAPLSKDPTVAAAQQAFPDTVRAIEALAAARVGPAATTPSTTAPNSPAPNSIAPNDTVPGAVPSTTGAAAAPATGPITGLLDAAAGIIEQDVGTRVVLVSANGFDTHAGQSARHTTLLADLSVGIHRFLARVAAAGRADDVVVLTTSEFGRRVAENGSGGTDHGNASALFLAGAPVVGGRVVGEARLAALVDGDLPVVIDARSTYAAVLDWLGGPTDEVLGGSYDRLGLLRP
jgi:uncharacterized protein (DUF1501 family)